MIYIYMLFFYEDSGVCYIGQTNNPKERYRQHLFPSTLKIRSIKNNWVKKHFFRGEELRMEIIEVCNNRAAANIQEQYWIKEFRAAGFQLCNATDGGDGISGNVRSEEHRARISMSLKRTWQTSPERWAQQWTKRVWVFTERRRKQWNDVLAASRGRPKSLETRRNMGKAQKLRWVGKSPEERNRLRDYRELHGNPLTGTKNSPETIAKRVQGLAKHYHLLSPDGQSIHVVNMADFCRKNGLDKRNISALISGRQRSHRGWRLDSSHPQGYKCKNDSLASINDLADEENRL